MAGGYVDVPMIAVGDQLKNQCHLFGLEPETTR